MSPNHSASRWYAYNARPDLLKPKVTVHDATVKRFDALFTAPPAPVFIPQKPRATLHPAHCRDTGSCGPTAPHSSKHRT